MKVPVEQSSGVEVSRKIRRKIEFFVEHFKGWGEVHPLFKRWLDRRMRADLLSRSFRFGEIVEAYFDEELDYLLEGLWLCERDIESYVITFSVDAVSCGFYAIDLLESFYRDPDFWNDPALKFIARAFPIFFVEVGRGLAGKILKEYLVGYARALGCDGWYSYSHDGNRVFVIRGRVSTIRRRLALLRDRQEKMGCESFNRSLVSGRFRIRPDTYS
ncbi:MAG: hypothetical protein N3E49_09615, partial [Bacteroidia bacterium]|nr:hypothetical protein [Bacteroidia bacterium]